MKISVTNLGPIKAATVELGGLTVFVGPNGTGKSYLAKVIYGLQTIRTIIDSSLSYDSRFFNTLFGREVSTAEEALLLLQALTPASIQQVIPALVNLHAELFKDRLGEFFNDDSDMFNNTTICYSDIPNLDEQRLEMVLNAAIKNTNESINAQKDILLGGKLFLFCWSVFSAYGYGKVDYFPAARSNFMLTYKELYRARADEHVGLGSVPFKGNNALGGIGSIPEFFDSKGNNARKMGSLIRFDRPTEDFIRHLYDLDTSKENALSAIAAKLQKQLYGEEQFLVEQPEGAFPDFRYQVRHSENKIRLHLASSMVTETSPILMGLKYWVGPNSLVIIDEPESHLHPEAQRDLINVLADAINQDLKVILITHSPYILSCINNLIKLQGLKEKFPDDADVQALLANHPDMVPLEKQVCAYHFDPDGSVKNIVHTSGLIDEAEFTEPFDRINGLYERMRDIEWEHRG